MPRSAATDTKPMPSPDPLTMPASSASPELKAIVCWAFGPMFQEVCTLTQTPPGVGLRVVAHLVDASPATDADLIAAVGKDRQLDVHAQVRRDRHWAHALTRPP